MSIQGLLAYAKDLIGRLGAAGIPARLFGSLAFEMIAPPTMFAGPPRRVKDIDVVIPRRHYRAAAAQLHETGWALDLRSIYFGDARHFGARHGNGASLDVYTDPLQLNQRLVLGRRLSTCALTLTCSDLLLTKLQVVGITERDLADVIALVSSCEISDADECRSTLSAGRIARQCASSWGLHRSAKENIRQAVALSNTLVSEEARARFDSRAQALSDAIDREPKTTRWRIRSVVGTRFSWYHEID